MRFESDEAPCFQKENLDDPTVCGSAGSDARRVPYHVPDAARFGGRPAAR